MCKLFLAINNIKKNDIIDFLHQSDKEPVACDGFGFAWLNKNKWVIYKNEFNYTVDNKIMNVIDEIDTNIVIGHLRHICPSCVSTHINNTHPFIYQNQIFVHNGALIDFDKKKICTYIDKNLSMHIKGTTDSEYMFFLLLTIKNKIYNDYPNLNEKIKLKRTFNKFFYILKKISKKIFANIIFATNKFVVITRYANKKHTKLFINNTHRIHDTNTLITTVPIKDNNKLIGINKIIIKEI
jgi:predicted glutamine amidotransferase